MEAVPEKNEESSVPKNPDTDLSNDKTALPETSKLELNNIPNGPKPSAEEPATESASDVKAREQEDEKNTVEIKPELPSTPLKILEPQEELKNMVANVTVSQDTDAALKNELTPENSIKQVEGPAAVPEQQSTPMPSPVKEEDKEDAKSSLEKGSPAKPRFQKKVSGSGSAADNSGVDLNLSISSFISKSKEEGSVSVQVRISDRRSVRILKCN